MANASLTVQLAQPQFKPDWEMLWEAYLTFYETQRPKEVYECSWARILSEDEQIYSYLAFEGGKAIGLANFLYHRSFWEIPDRCYLNDLIVLPKARGLGAGRALINAVRGHATARGCEKLYWTTAQDNHTARALYDQVATLTPFIKYDVDL